MKRFIETLKNIWRIQELKDKILLTLGLLFVYRVGSNVVLPGINPESLTALQSQAATGIFGLLNAFTGGAFAKASVLAIGIMPYISASIVVQLLGLAVPAVQKMQKDGESGRRRLNQITRYLTVIIAGAQAPAYLANLSQQLGGAAILPGLGGWLIPGITLVAGTIFAMWLGERITDKGIGNGISLIIMVGIIASLPQAFLQELTSQTSPAGGGFVVFLLEVVALYLVIIFAIALTQAVRQVPLQYAKSNASGRVGQPIGRKYLPLRVNAAGVMPIIFAQAIMFIPITLLQVAGGSNETLSPIMAFLSDIQGFGYNFMFALLIVVFTYFYTAIQVNTNNIAEDLKRNGGFIPGVKPGQATAEYIDNILSRITLPGSLLLAAIAVLPALAMKTGMIQQWANFYGGTSLLIIVGVVLDTLMQIESYLLNRHYDGLMKSGRIKGRVTENAL